MRAFMSGDRKARHAVTGWPSCDAQDASSYLAMREAKRILSVTEPIHALQAWYSSREPTGFTEFGLSALAESLATFLKEN